MEKKYRAALISLGSVSSKMTADAMRNYFAEVDELQIREIEVVLGQKHPILYQAQPIKSYDCVFVKGSFRYATISYALTNLLHNNSYMPIAPESFTIVHDKILSHVQLTRYGVDTPKTYLSATPHAAKELLKRVNYPIIMKLPRGTQGKGVMFADSFPAASSLLDTLQSLNQPFLIQEYVETGGVDVRAFVVGDRVVAAMKRKASGGEKRSNVHAGGSTEAFEMPLSMKKLALDTAKAMGAEVCGIDILETARGPVVIEANLSPGLQGITKATGKDIAGEIAKLLFNNTDKLRQTEVRPNAQEIIDETSSNAIQTIVGAIDFRGRRMLLPDVVSMMSGIKEGDDCHIQIQKGKVEIKKGL